MFRVLVAASVWALAVGVSRADMAPRPQFTGAWVDYKITTEKDHPDYKLFTVSGEAVQVVRLDRTTPFELKGTGRVRPCALVAVPKAAAAAYLSEPELHDAIRGGKVEGMKKAKVDFAPVARGAGLGAVVVREYTLTKIDTVDGIVLVAKDPDAEARGRDEPYSFASRQAAPWFAGFGISVLVVVGGLRLIGRRSRAA